MNLCFNKSSESSYNPNESYKKPRFAYEFSPFESIYKIDMHKTSLKKYVEEEMQKFNKDYDILQNKTSRTTGDTINYRFEQIFDAIKQWTKLSKMESEIPIMALVYIERLMKKTGVLLNEQNWSRIVLITLCIASKIWDDDSLENEHFAKVLPNITLKEISVLEKTFLNLIEYEVMVTSKQFAKYAFIMSSFCNESIPDLSSPIKQRSVKKYEFESERLQYKYRSRAQKS